MNKDKVSSQEIIDLVALKASVSKRAAEEFLKVMIATIEDTLLVGDVVKIKNFGTFKLQWNEPRKSVNVQTGEDILIEGYHKVSFTPDSFLKELVNEPFAHLEAVQLDGEVQPKVEIVNDDTLEPLKIFTEQAFEIKNLISEINALSVHAKPENEEANEVLISTEEANLEPVSNIEDDLLPIEEEVVIENLMVQSFVIEEVKAEAIEKEEIIIEERELEQPEKEDANLFVTNDNETTHLPIIGGNNLSDSVSNSEPESNPFLNTFKPRKRSNRRRWFWAIMILFFVFSSVISLYFLFPPATKVGDKVIAKIDVLYSHVRDNFSVTSMLNDISKWVSPAPEKLQNTEIVVISNDSIVSDSLISEQPIDSLQILFDTPRVYPVFIASERIVHGSRLARMSERYYGVSDFWVYIYEANRDRFENPDQIPAGSLIRIPKLNPLLIDASNPRCINKAKELHDLYVKKSIVQ